MKARTALALSFALTLVAGSATAQTNPLWHEEKTRNYLPHMTWPEVKDLLTRTDMVIVPVGALEQHGPQSPMGTDFYNGLERALLVAQRTDVLVAPVLLPGSSPYHMAFAGTITLSADTIQRVYFEAAQSLIRHGFKRFLFLNGHAGNAAITRFVVDRVNQETAGIAVDLGEAAAPFQARPARMDATADPARFDRHAGVGETSDSLYLTPNLVNLAAAEPTTVILPPHLAKMLPDVVAGDATATRVFLAEALKAEDTGKHTSTREMTKTGVWSARNPSEATVERGRASAEAFVEAAVKFIERWKQLRPLGQ